MNPPNADPEISHRVDPGYTKTIAHLENLMVAICDFTDGPMKRPELPHSHPHEQITYVAEGKLLFIKGEEEKILQQGDMITVSPDVPHCIQTLTAHVRLIDSFHPPRKDFIDQL